MQVGWEVTSVVELLKASGSEIVMVVKAGLLHAQEEELGREEEIDEGLYNARAVEATNGIAAEVSCDSLDRLAVGNDRAQQAGVSTESDSDLSSPDSILKARVSIHRTASNPLLDGKTSGVGVARRLSDSLDLEETDGGTQRMSECVTCEPVVHSV